MIDREAIRARWEAATPGPWWVERQHGVDVAGPAYPVHRGVTECDDPDDDCMELTAEANSDAEFVAHAPTDIAALLDALDEAERRGDDWRECSVRDTGRFVQALDARYAAEARLEEATALIQAIADGAPPQEGDYELQGDHGEDARYVYPKRMRWIRDACRAFLGTEEQ